MAEEQIFIVPYDPAWPGKFEEEKKLIEKTIGEFITRGIHHIGSTSIPGLSAKPIIDIMVGVESLEKSKPCIDLLVKIQYQYFPYKPDQEHWFCKPSPQHRTHHLHIIPASHPDFKARLAFRDYLRSHPEETTKYEELKKELADKFRGDREAYTDAKEKFVKEIVAKALVNVTVKPTSHEDINEILELLKTGIKNILGENLIGLYLTGSLTYGDFDRGSSDIDFIAIIHQDLSEEQLQEITEMHSKIGNSFPEWQKRIEGQYTPLDWFNSIERPLGKRIYVNGGKVNLHHYGNEWAINYFVLYECGVALAGPAPKDLLRPVDINDVREASNKCLLEEWLPKLEKVNPFIEKGYDTNHLQAYAILTMCRILHRANNDEVASKRKASAWVKKEYPEWNDLVEKAENWKHGIKINSEKETKKFIEFTVKKVNDNS